MLVLTFEIRCPYIYDNSPTTFLSDKTDCNVFYICDHSGPVKFNCPVGLEFSPTYHICDFPASAGCSSGTYSSGPSTGNGTYTYYRT